MNFPLLFATAKQRSVGLFWYAVGLFSYSWLMVWYWPLLGDAYKELVQNIPEGFLQAFAGGDIDLATMGGFFQTEYLGLMWIAIVATAVITYSVKAVASEVSGGTMELLLAQPLSRLAFVLTRVVGLVGYAVAVSAATFVPIAVLGPTYGVNLPGDVLWKLGAAGTLFMLAIGGFAFMLSAMSRDPGRPAAISAAVLGAMWVLHAVAQLADWAEAFEPFNLVKYWQPAALIDKGEIAPEMWWVYGGVAAVTLIAGAAVFLRRDVT
jgi:ABC-2 type transport system permease protein